MKKLVIFILATINLIIFGISNAEAATTNISTRIAIVDTGGGGGSSLKPWGINAPNACSGLSFSQSCLVSKR